MNIKSFMAQDHRDCDQLFATTENAVSKGDWTEAEQSLRKFIKAMDYHLGLEEKELFPAFEEATGVKTGPTEMMRMEHDQMRNLFTEMQDALEEKNSDDFLGEAETLLIMMQQHNIKEEQILYTMMDLHLTEDVDYWQEKYQQENKD